jgi:hypothetical protein
MKIKDTAQLAAQIVFEYPEWNDEHISEFMKLFDHDDPAPCTGDELYDACYDMQAIKNTGLSYDDAVVQSIKNTSST